MKFVHVATRTRHLDSAIAFYEALGMKESRRIQLEKGQATLAYVSPPEGNFDIELVYNWGKDDGYEGGERFGHFAFEVEDIDAVLPGISAAGGTVVREPYLLEGTGPRIAFVADPDGNWVELIQRSGW
jgi:lactoylglutathione lyase